MVISAIDMSNNIEIGITISNKDYFLINELRNSGAVANIDK